MRIVPSLAISRRLFQYLKPERARLGAAFACLLAVGTLSVAGPLTLRGLIDQGLGKANSRLVILFALALLAIEAFRQGADLLQGLLLRRSVQSAVLRIRVDLFGHLQTLSLASPLAKSLGERTSRITGDAASFGEALTTSLYGMIRDLVVLFGVTTTLLFLNPSFGFLAISCALAFGLPAIAIRRQAQALSRRSREALALANQILEENLTGQKVIVQFSMEEDRANRFSRANDELVKTALSSLRLQALFEGSASIISALALAFILWWGGRQVAAHALSIGLFVAVVQYVPQLLGAVRGLAEKSVVILSSVAAGDRVFEILGMPSVLTSSGPATARSCPQGDLIANELRFGYREDLEVLRGLTFQAHAGESIAIVGKTGAGKTTLARVLARLFDPWEGTVALKGADLRELSLRELRSRVVLMPQELTFFSRTIIENIALGDSRISQEAVISACRAAGADSFIERLSRGYETVLPEGGRTLSAGERQLLAFARVFARDPEVVVLDEPSAYLDQESEERVLGALRHLRKGRTFIMIAHRPTMLNYVDRVVKIERGLIASALRPGSGVACSQSEPGGDQP